LYLLYNIVIHIGDTIQNPFWPQGLGVNRGFHSSLDAVYAAYIMSTSSQNYELTLTELITAGKTREWVAFNETCLQSFTLNSPTWTADPISRYSRDIYKSIHFHDIEHHAKQPSLPLRIREFYNLKWS